MPDKSDLIREAIREANRKLQDAFQQRNARAISALYTEDAMLLPPGSEPIEGAGCVAEFWEAVLQIGAKGFQIEPLEIDPQGATAIDLGRYTLHDDAGELFDRGQYIVIWKLIQGEWRIHRDIWNSSLSGK